MKSTLHDILVEMSAEYCIQEAQLLEYAERGCLTEYNDSLDNYINSNAELVENMNVCREFIVSVITSGMSDELQNILKESPFTRFQYKKPSSG